MTSAFKITNKTNSSSLPPPPFLRPKEQNKMTSYLDQLFDFRRNQQLKKMRFADFQIEKVLQKGEKNEVLLVTNKKHVAFGKLVLKKLNNKNNKKNFIQNEITAGRKLKHNSIVKMVHHWVENDYTYLLFEYIEGKDMYDFLASNEFTPLEETEAKELFRQLLKAVKYVHKKGFVHGDLKLENIMITKAGKLKLIDFGFSTEKSCKTLLNCYQGSLEYLSPEILQRTPYVGCKAEVWSIGVILYTLLFGEFPFSEQERDMDFEDVIVGFPRSSVSPAAKDLLRKMLAVDAKDRFEIEDVLKHSWMSK